MKTFIKANWFKLGILITLIILSSGVFMYVQNINKIATQEREDKIRVEAETKAQEEVLKQEQQQALLLEQKKADTQKTITTKTQVSKNEQIVSQIIKFEDVLEGKLVDAGINCISLATYNNVTALTPSQFSSQYSGLTLSEMFPNTKEFYEDRCRSSVVEVNLTRNTLIAEPELKTLRTMLTTYIDDIKEIGDYALSGGSLNSVINKSGKDMEVIRTDAREELLRVQRLYNVKPQYVGR
jgi:hypothetical protein